MQTGRRLANFQTQLAENYALAFLPFSADLAYLTGIPRQLPDFGAVTHPGDWLEGLWLVPGRDPILLLTRMSAEFGGQVGENVSVHILGDFDDPYAWLKNLLGKSDVSAIAVCERARAETLIKLQQILPHARFLSATEMLHTQCSIKDDQEIDMMRKAGAITEMAFEQVLIRLKTGITELDIISEIDYQLRRLGSLGSSFSTSIYAVGPDHDLMFGDVMNSWPRKLYPPVCILFDFGAIYEGYCYDYGRTVALGDPGEEFRKVFGLVVATQQVGIQALCPGNRAAEVEQAARRLVENAGYHEAFRHRLGHGIGLDVHEPPFLAQSDYTVIQPGMCFTVEPSLIFPRRCSARVEDVVMVGEKGGIPLTTGFQELLIVDG
jgi:Xaa-Pro aminopeptidase